MIKFMLDVFKYPGLTFLNFEGDLCWPARWLSSRSQPLLKRKSRPAGGGAEKGKENMLSLYS